MGRRGPKKTPTELKIAAGTHRRDRDGDPDAEARGAAVASNVPAPKDLGTEGKKKWRATLKILATAKIVRETDLDALRQYCREWELVRQCEADIEEHGITIETEGGRRQNPAVAIRDKAANRMLAYQREFCMTPSARAGKGVAPAKSRRVATRTRPS